MRAQTDGNEVGHDVPPAGTAAGGRQRALAAAPAALRQPTGYARLEIELTRPLAPLRIDDGFEGIAVLVRRDRRPVGFWMEPIGTSRSISTEALAERIARHVAVDLLHSALDQRLPLASQPLEPGAAPRPFSLSVAICTRDRPEWLTRCLLSLRGVVATRPAASQVEVLVVDNASSDDGTRRAVEAFEEVRYLHEPVPGLDFARNRALAAARGEFIAFLDDDVVVDAGWLEGLVGAFRDHPDAGGFSGLVLPLELETPAQLWFEKRGGFGRGFRRIRFRDGHRGDPWFPLSAGCVGTGANMAFKRELVLALGGFDEALDTGPPLPGGGDLDMFYRVIRAGHDLVYEPSYMVFHHHRRELDALHRQLDSWGSGPMAMWTKIYALEPSQRGPVRSLLAWWFRDQARRLASSLVKRKLPASLVVAELRGGVRGLLGEYARSQKRVQRRKEQHTRP